MGADLIATWLDAAGAIPVIDEASVSLVREAVRARCAEVGLARDASEALVTAASELAHNQRRHARGGAMLARRIERGGGAGVEVVAADAGGGISAIEAALRGDRPPAASATGMGAGLAGVYRLADEVDIDVRRGEGSCLRARKLASPSPRTEIAILGRALPGEAINGDHAAAVYGSGGLLLAVADGLGHGEPAREAADRAIEIIHRQPDADVAGLLRQIDSALSGTRGAALSIAQLDPAHGSLTHGGVGNIATQLYPAGGGSVRLPPIAGVAGSLRGRTIRPETILLPPRYVLLMFTDGLSIRADLATDLDLLRQPAAVIAERLLGRFAKDHDDALILVATAR